MRSTIPILYTSRLILREIQDSDASDMYEYATNPSVGPNAGWEPHTSLNYTRNIIAMFRHKPSIGQLGVYAIILKENDKMIGTVELHTYLKNFKAELGYTINPLYWGNGYAVEASKAIVAWGFCHLGLRRIECKFFLDNVQSKRVCEKLGFRYEGISRNGYMLYDQSIHDLANYAMTDADFFQLFRTGNW